MPSNRRQSAGRLLPALLFIATAFLASCHTGQKYPPYSPQENLLSIATEFSLAASLDPFRDAPGKDLTGQNIARSTLVRLANYESLHPGRLTPELLTMKGRALELLGDYESARRNFLDAAGYDTELKADCLRRAENLQRLLFAITPPAAGTDLATAVEVLAAQARELKQLSTTFKDPFYSSLALREEEGAEVRRAELMAQNRYVLPDGERQAQLALEQLVADNRDSHRALEHALRLAHFHQELAEEEARLNPPELTGFSAERFKAHYDAAVDLLYRISQADGRPERIVARHELDAMLAFGEQIRRRAQ